MSYRKSSASGGSGSSKKYTPVNASIHKPPSQHVNQQGKLLVLHRPTTKNIAPAPINTSSLRRENNGKDTTVALVPVGQTTVWGAGSKSADDSSQQDSEQQQSQLSSKPAPWAKTSETPDPTPVPQTTVPKMQSWAASDSEDSDDDSPAPVPVPGYLTSPLTSSPSLLPVPPSSQVTSSPVVPHTTSIAPSSTAPTSTTGVTNPVIRRNLADMTGDYSGSRPGFGGRDRERGDSRDRDMGPYHRGGDVRGDARGDFRNQQPQSSGWSRHGQDTERDRYNSGPSGGQYPSSGGFEKERSNSWGRSDARSGIAPGIVTTPGIVRVRPTTIIPAASATGHGGAATGGGPKIDSGMSEEQKALERARYEREQLEMRKRQQVEDEENRRREEENRKREEENRKREDEARARQEEESEKLRQERQREREREIIERERESRYRDPEGRDEGRWERAAISQTRPSPRNEAPGYRQAEEYRPRLYSGDGGREKDWERKDRSFSMDSSGSRGSRGSDRERFQSNISNTYPHHVQHDAPTRILQPPTQQKKLFDSKSGNFVVQKEKETTNTVAPKSILGAKAPHATGNATRETRDSQDNGQQSRDKQREARVAEMNALALEEQRKRDAKLAANKKARAKERAERQPRTKGVLFRFISTDEAEEMQQQSTSTGSSAHEVHSVGDKVLARVLSSFEEKLLADKDAQGHKPRSSHQDKDEARKAKKLHKDQKLAAKKLRQTKAKEEPALLGQDLEALAITDEDMLGEFLQESVEFQEVKSKRTVAQEKKHGEPEAESSPAPREKKDARPSRIGGSGSNLSSAASSPAPPSTTTTTSVQPAATIAPPAQPAWIGTGDTFKAIGVAVPEPVEEKGKKGKQIKDKKTNKIEKLKKDGRTGSPALPPSAPNSAKKANAKADRDSRKNKRNGAESHGPATGQSKDASNSFDVTAATRHLLAPPQQQHHSTTDILDMSAEIDQQDLSHNISYSRFVPGIGLTGDMDGSGAGRNSPSPSRSIEGRGVGSDTGNLEALIGLGNTASVSSFESSVAWKFNTNADDESPSYRSHSNSNVSDDENAYTHHTQALTQLTEGDDDHDLPYSGHSLTPPKAEVSDNISNGSVDGNVTGEGKPDRSNGVKSRSGKFKATRGGKGGKGGRGGREASISRGGRGGRGSARGPPAVSHTSVTKADGDVVSDKVTQSSVKKFVAKEKDSSNLKIDDSGVKVSRKKLVGDKPAVQQVEKNVVVVPGGKGGRGSGGKGSSSFGGRGGKSSGGRGRGGGKGGRGNNPRGPPAVSS